MIRCIYIYLTFSFYYPSTYAWSQSPGIRFSIKWVPYEETRLSITLVRLSLAFLGIIKITYICIYHGIYYTVLLELFYLRLLHWSWFLPPLNKTNLYFIRIYVIFLGPMNRTQFLAHSVHIVSVCWISVNRSVDLQVSSWTGSKTKVLIYRLNSWAKAWSLP